jgi:hypothetical protein
MDPLSQLQVLQPVVNRPTQSVPGTGPTQPQQQYQYERESLHPVQEPVAQSVVNRPTQSVPGTGYPQPQQQYQRQERLPNDHGISPYQNMEQVRHHVAQPVPSADHNERRLLPSNDEQILFQYRPTPLHTIEEPVPDRLNQPVVDTIQNTPLGGGASSTLSQNRQSVSSYLSSSFTSQLTGYRNLPKP